MFNFFWGQDMSYTVMLQMTYRCLYYSRYVLKQFCHENMIKTLINPRYNAFDQTAGTIGQLLVHSDIHASTIGNSKSDADGRRIGRRTSFYQLLFIYSSTKYNTLSLNTDQAIVSAASLFLLPIQRTTTNMLL